MDACAYTRTFMHTCVWPYMAQGGQGSPIGVRVDVCVFVTGCSTSSTEPEVRRGAVAANTRARAVGLEDARLWCCADANAALLAAHQRLHLVHGQRGGGDDCLSKPKSGVAQVRRKHDLSMLSRNVDRGGRRRHDCALFVVKLSLDSDIRAGRRRRHDCALLAVRVGGVALARVGDVDKRHRAQQRVLGR